MCKPRKIKNKRSCSNINTKMCREISKTILLSIYIYVYQPHIYLYEDM